REDGQQSGAWVAIDAVRRGEYQIKRGDLLVFRRGNAGLGHVSRVDVPPQNGVAIAVGANENNQWMRRERPLSEPELEGVIRYSDLQPIFTAEVLRTGLSSTDKPANLAMQPVALVSQPASSPPPTGNTSAMDRWARGVILRAYAMEHPGVTPTPREIQAIQAIGRHEGFYGYASSPPIWAGTNNWGAEQCGKPPCEDKGCFEYHDTDDKGVRYTICFKKHPTPEAGAKSLIHQVTTRRPKVWAAIKTGVLKDVAQRMSERESKEVGVYHQTPVPRYANALWRNVQEIARSVGEPLVVGDETAPNLPAVAPTPTQPTTQPSTRPMEPRPRKSRGLQAGMNALVASRRRKVGVGGPLQDQFEELNNRLDVVGVEMGALAKECDATDQIFARTMGLPVTTSPPALPLSLGVMAQAQALHVRLRALEARLKAAGHSLQPTTGFSTNNTVLDQATRVDDYIRALHTIISEERLKRSQPDGFPWNEWAAYRVSWDEAFFRIKHGFILWTDDTVVHEYELLSKEWANIVERVYDRRPMMPTIDRKKASMVKLLGLVGVGVVTAVAAVAATRKK
ncbi:MAG TPA: hypothetical protein PK156_33695, partial [Polyangium sp.]|nr:hypothetical protein [Polyangium sp.]